MTYQETDVLLFVLTERRKLFEATNPGQQLCADRLLDSAGVGAGREPVDAAAPCAVSGSPNQTTGRRAKANPTEAFLPSASSAYQRAQRQPPPGHIKPGRAAHRTRHAASPGSPRCRFLQHSSSQLSQGYCSGSQQQPIGLLISSPSSPQSPDPLLKASIAGSDDASPHPEFRVRGPRPIQSNPTTNQSQSQRRSEKQVHFLPCSCRQQ